MIALREQEAIDARARTQFEDALVAMSAEGVRAKLNDPEHGFTFLCRLAEHFDALYQCGRCNQPLISKEPVSAGLERLVGADLDSVIIDLLGQRHAIPSVHNFRRQVDRELGLILQQDAVNVGGLARFDQTQIFQQMEAGGCYISHCGLQAVVPDGVRAELSVAAVIKTFPRMCYYYQTGFEVVEAEEFRRGLACVGQFHFRVGPAVGGLHAVGGVARSGGVEGAVESNIGAMPGKFPQRVGYGNGPGIERGANEPGGVFAGFGIGDVHPIVGLPETPLWPGNVHKAKVLINKRDHRQQRPFTPLMFDQIQLKTGMDLRTNGIRINQTGDDGKVGERGIDINAPRRLAG